ncbi:MAG: flagellar motor switch protein FliN [Bacteriovoracaceae bacterium]|nr:flagellar motor switch protein FliN [Bacteriovoracaceae bacterium]
MAEETTPPSGEELKMSELTQNQASGAGRSIDFLLDVPLTLSVELGRTRMIVNDLLQLGQGSVVELTKLVGEPLEVLVNEKLIARGEVVVLNDKFAVRLTDIISPKDRLDKLS